jgi:hypothetical protein
LGTGLTVHWARQAHPQKWSELFDEPSSSMAESSTEAESLGQT